MSLDADGGGSVGAGGWVGGGGGSVGAGVFVGGGGGCVGGSVVGVFVTGTAAFVGGGTVLVWAVAGSERPYLWVVGCRLVAVCLWVTVCLLGQVLGYLWVLGRRPFLFLVQFPVLLPQLG